jgi:hypothetical protein
MPSKQPVDGDLRIQEALQVPSVRNCPAAAPTGQGSPFDVELAASRNPVPVMDLLNIKLQPSGQSGGVPLVEGAKWRLGHRRADYSTEEGD